MVNKLSFLILAFTLVYAGCKSQSFITISKKIDQAVRAKTGKKGYTEFHKVRLKLFNAGKLDFITLKDDTIYLLESQEIDTRMEVGKIWNNKKSINYSYLNNNFNFSYKAFTSYTTQLIQSWDTLTIRKEEKLNSHFAHGKVIHGTRVITNNGLQRINTITFKEFIDFKRDFE